jgi:hypothetical protein
MAGKTIAEIREESKNSRNFGKYIGLENRQPYPIFFSKDGKTVLERQSGSFELECDIVGDSSNLKENKKKHRTAKREIQADVSLAEICKIGRLVNGANIRYGEYEESKRGGTVETFLLYSEILLEATHGVSIIAKNIKVENGHIKFDVPHIKLTGNETLEEVAEIEKENKLYGVADGQNLLSIAACVCRAVEIGLLDESYPLDEVYIRVVFYEFDDTIPFDIRARICSAKNTVVEQGKYATASFEGFFEEFVSPVVKQGVETKLNESLYEFCEKSDIENLEYTDEDNEPYKNSKIAIDEFIRCNGILSDTQKMLRTDRFKKYEDVGFDSEFANIGLIYPDVIHLSRMKGTCIKKVYSDKKSNVGNPYNSVFNDDLQDIYWNGIFNGLITYDYSKLEFTENHKNILRKVLGSKYKNISMVSMDTILKTLSIKPSKNKVVSPFSNNAILYDVPVLIKNFYPYISALLFETHRDTVTKKLIVSCPYNKEEVISKMFEILPCVLYLLYERREAAKKRGSDSFCFCTKQDKECQELWDKILKITFYYKK